MEIRDTFEMGKAAAKRGDVVTASQCLGAVATRKPGSTAAFFLALAEFNSGRTKVAGRRVKRLLQKRPKHAGGLALSARIALSYVDQSPLAVKKMIWKRAIELLQAAIQARLGFRAAEKLLAEVFVDQRYLYMTSLLTDFDHRFRVAKTKADLEKLLPAAAKIAAEDPGPRWNYDPVLSKVHYFRSACSVEWALQNYDPDLIETSVAFDYMTWPKRILANVKGRKVLDVGCGFGGFGTGFLAAGATSYVGLDPAMDLDSTHAKNKHTRTWSNMGVTPREIMARIPAIRLFQGTSEDLNFSETFDTIALHNVTEHLLQLEAVLKGLVPLCHDETRLVYLHHNFYCWNGHHFAPNRTDHIDPNDGNQRQVMDWNHIDAVPKLPDTHYFKTRLNRVRLDEIHEITARYFEIEQWDEIPSNDATLLRYSDDVLARVRGTIPSLTERDLKTHVVFCVAKRRA